MKRLGRPRARITAAQIQHEITTNRLTLKAVAAKFGLSEDTVQRRMKELAKKSVSVPAMQ